MQKPIASKPYLVSLMDMIFILLIFFIILSLLAIKGGHNKLVEAEISIHVPAMIGEDYRTRQGKIANLAIYIYQENDQIKYLLLHPHLGERERNNPQPYINLMQSSTSPCNKFPQIITKEQSDNYPQDDLDFTDLMLIIDQFTFCTKSKEEEPIVVILASRAIPFYEIVKVFNYCYEQKKLNYVSLNIAGSKQDLYHKVSIRRKQ